MLDTQDIQKLIEVLATKQDIQLLEARIAVLELKMERVIDVLDKMSLRLEALHQEYLILKERDTRYERWFREIAEKVGITLTP